MGFSHKYFIILFAVFMVSCSASHDGSSDSGSNNGTITPNPNPDPVLEFEVIALFNSSCVSCHNGSQVPDLRPSAIDALKDNAFYVNIGDGDNSLLYRRMTGLGAAMPTSGLLAGSETDKVKDWIDDLGVVTGVEASTFAEIETAVLIPKCYSCHATQAPIFQDYASVLSTMVTPNNLDSPFYMSVTTGSLATSDLMPVGQTALTIDETDDIASWIMNGAPND